MIFKLIESKENLYKVQELVRCSFHHFINDGYSWCLYPLLPLIAADFGLTYGGAGAIKTAFNVLLSATSIPFGFLAERFGELLILTMGTTVFSLCIAVLGTVPSYSFFMSIAFISGAGAGASHPVGNSLVSRSSPEDKMNTFISVFNFSGDVGKALLPAAAGFLAATFSWRIALLTLGTVGAVSAVALSRWGPTENEATSFQAEQTSTIRDKDDHSAGWGIKSWVQFGSLNAVGIIDSLARSGVVTFASFLLADKGFATSTVAAMLSIIAAGGAVGKLFCGPLADWMGEKGAIILTEILTSLSIVLLVLGSGLWIYPVLFALGAVLNGTSSILYALVPKTTTDSDRSRGFGIYYTTTLAASGLAPLIYGFVSDLIGLYTTYYLMAGVLLLTIPMCFILMHSRGSLGKYPANN